jgi:hypothetical protein
MSKTIINGHTSPASAHLTFAYPFSARGRCVRREWIEQATSGPKKGEYRFVTQTTHPSFNAEYTRRIQTDGQDTADLWAREQLASVRWNAPKPSGYYAFAVLVNQPLEDNSGRIGTTYLGITLLPWPEHLRSLKADVGTQLTDEQRKAVQTLERFSRRVSPASWKEADEKFGPDCSFLDATPLGRLAQTEAKAQKELHTATERVGTAAPRPLLPSHEHLRAT